MTDKPALQLAARAAKQAAGRFADRGELNESAISQAMADRYTKQINEMKEA